MNKNALKKKSMSILLAGSLIFGSGKVLNAKANAYNLDKPTISASEFEKYTGVKIFINGRLVEFNDSLGYPYIDAEAGRTMIPLRAVAETFNATVGYQPEGRRVSVVRFNHEAKLQIDKDLIWYTDMFNTKQQKIQMDTKAIIKNDRTYIPLRALFECFGLSVRWDGEKRIAHIETVGEDIFDNIDFKDKKIIHISELDISKVNKVIYDEVEVNKSYVEILKNSDQYKVFVEDEVAHIFSYQFLSTINYLYSKQKELIEKIPEEEKFVSLGYLLENEALYFLNISDFDLKDKDTSFNAHPSNIGKTYKAYKYIDEDFQKYFLAKEKAKEIADSIRKQTSDKEEQIKLANDYICNIADYHIEGAYSNGYAYNVFFEGKSFCNGYQSAFQMIMKELNIMCVSVIGKIQENDDDLHTWSEVFVNGEWKLVDVTQNDGSCNNYLLFKKGERNMIFYMEPYEEDIELFKLTYKFD